MGDCLLLCGDVNCAGDDGVDEELLTLLSEHGLIQTESEPTRGNKILDIQPFNHSVNADEEDSFGGVEIPAAVDPDELFEMTLPLVVTDGEVDSPGIEVGGVDVGWIRRVVD